MPETSIHEHDQPQLWKYKIWLSENRLMTTPTSDPVRSEQSYKRDLGILIASATNAGHDIGALFYAEYICHIVMQYRIPNSRAFRRKLNLKRGREKI